MIPLKRLLILAVAFDSLASLGLDAQELSPSPSMQIQFIRTVGADPSAEQVQRLLELSGDTTVIPLGALVPIDPLTVSEVAGDKLSALAGNGEVQRLALEYIENREVSLEQFESLLRAFRWQSLSDLQSARLQDAATRMGVKFTRALLRQLGSASEEIDESFDLAITELLSHRSLDSVVVACEAILNRRDRVLLWNERLADLCHEPMIGGLARAPDVIESYDFRNLVLQTLRTNGFPSSDLVSFLKTFDPGRGTELYWQHKATKYTILGDTECLDQLFAALLAKDSRDVVAKVLAADVRIPSEYKLELLQAAIAQDDLAGARLASLFIEQFPPDGLTEKDVEMLGRALDESSTKMFDSWRRPVGTEN